jgi:hypothetical protein
MSHCPVCKRYISAVAPHAPRKCTVCGWTSQPSKKSRQKRILFKAESAEEIARRETAKSPFSATSLLVIGLGILIILMLTFQTLQKNSEQDIEEYIPVYHSAKPSATAATPTPIYTFMAIPSTQATPEVTETTASPSPASTPDLKATLEPPPLTASMAPEASASP